NPKVSVWQHDKCELRHASGSQAALMSHRIALLILGLSLAPGSALAGDQVWDGVFRFQSRLAEQGQAEAQFKLGEMYEEGRRAARDEAQALLWYRRAAAQGHAEAQARIKARAEARDRTQREAAQWEKARQEALAAQRRAQDERAA